MNYFRKAIKLLFKIHTLIKAITITPCKLQSNIQSLFSIHRQNQDYLMLTQNGVDDFLKLFLCRVTSSPQD